jgi:hypothetical protein
MEGVSFCHNDRELWVLDHLGAYVFTFSQSRSIKGNVACILRSSIQTTRRALRFSFSNKILQNGTSLTTVQGSWFIAQLVDAQHSVCFGLVHFWASPPARSSFTVACPSTSTATKRPGSLHGAPACSPTGGNTLLCSDDGNNVAKEPVISESSSHSGYSVNLV